MDKRLITIIERLSGDLANLEKALSSARGALSEVIKDTRKNGGRLSKANATRLFLANQQPRWSSTAPWRVREMDEEN